MSSCMRRSRSSFSLFLGEAPAPRLRAERLAGVAGVSAGGSIDCVCGLTDFFPSSGLLAETFSLRTVRGFRRVGSLISECLSLSTAIIGPREYYCKAFHIRMSRQCQRERCLSSRRSWRVAGKDEIAVFHRNMTRIAGLMLGFVCRLAVLIKLGVAPAAGRGIFLRVLDHEL